MRYEDASGAFQASGPIANDDADTLAAGSRGPATGNLITGEGTQYGEASADNAAGAHVAAIAGQGGEDSSFSGGKLSVSGQYGSLSVDAEGNYSYLANKGAPENVRDRFTYTLADNQGNTDTGALIVEIGKTPAVIKADAQQVVVGPDGVVTLPPGVELSDIMVVGRNLVVNMPDGTQMIIVDGAVFVPQLVLGGVEVPATNVAALLIGQEPQPAAGEVTPSSGGNFALPPAPLDPGVPLGDLLPPTEYDYTPPEPEEVLDFLNDDPEVFVQPDGQPAQVNAVDQVEEAGLPTRNGGEPAGSGESADGNGADDDVTSETTGGTILINSPDGVDSVTITGADGVAHEIVVGLVVEGEFGTLTITGIVGDDYTYTYVLNDNSSGDDTQDDFSIVLTDSDGDTATATLTIDIVDDVPTARPDTDVIASGQFGPATGNVLTDASAGDAGDGDSGADTVGADDAELTDVTGFGDTESVEGGWVVQGQYGVLTINADGSYSYVRDPGTPGGVEDVFNYTLTDGDGDTSSTTLTISIGDEAPQTGPNPVAQLDDDALPNGIPGGVGDDADALNLSGNLTGVGGDGALTFNVLLTGAPTGFSYVSGGAGVVLVQQGGVTVLTVTVNAATGAYTIVQNAPIDHPAGSNENNVSFTINYHVTDQDGDSAPGTITINVDDDSPEMSRADVSVPALAVDETDLTVNASGDYSVVFDGAFGADGPGTISYAVGVVAGTDSGLVDVATGDPILLFMNGGVVEGRVGGADGPVAFTVSVDGETGVVTLDQVRALEHPENPNNDEAVSAVADSIQLTATITDGDGDSDSLTVNIGHTLTFDDDGPSVAPEVNADATVTVDESLPSNDAGIDTGSIVKGNDPDLGGGIAIGQASSGAAIVDANAVFGADGPAAGGGISYALSITSADAGVTLTDGTPIVLQLVGGVIVGVVDGGAFDGQAAFAIAIDPTTGVVTVEQYLSLDHPVNPDPNDPLGLGDNTVAVTVTATDGDGDSVTSGAIDISGQISFLDDGPAVAPTVDAQATVTVDESLPSNDPGIDTGAIVKGNDPDLGGGLALGQASSGVAVVNANAVFGADGAAAGGGIGYALSITSAASVLTLTDGSAINLQMVGGVIVGVVASGAFAGQAAFAIAINPATGVVTVEQYLSLGHPVNPDPNDPLGLGDNTVAVTVTATDGDGDPVTSGAIDISGQISFLDDGPSIDPTVNAQAGVTVDESLPSNDPGIDTGAIVKGNDPDLDGGLALGQASSGVAIVDANAVFGADGAAAGGGIGYTLSITNAASGLTLTDGSAINLQMVGGVIVGVVASGAFAGQAAFAIAINPTTGVVTVEQYLSLDHPVNPDPNDPLSLGDNTIAVTVTATDGDGDSATSGAIDISDRITFHDDGPNAQVNGQATLDALVLDETTPPGTETDGDSDPAGRVSTTANFADNFVTPVNYGADGPGSVSYSFVLNGDDVPSGLYAVDPTDTETAIDGYGRGAEIVLNVSGDGLTITGSAGGVDYFTITIDPATGVVTFTQLDNVWHANTGSDDDTSTLMANLGSLLIRQTVVDGDGDSDTADLDVSGGVFQIEDDGPVARNDVDEILAGGDTAEGNVISGVGTNGGALNADDVGADSPGRVSAVSSVNEPLNTDQDPDPNVFEIDGEFGTLVLNADGSYTYTRSGGAPGNAQDVFTYTLTDADGDTTTATLTISIGDSAPNLPDPAAVLLDDDALAGGNPGGTNDDADSAGLPGQLSGTGGDGDLTYNFTGIDNLPAGFTANPVDASTVQILQGATVVLTITLDNDTGAFNVVQNNPIVHLGADTENNYEFEVGVEVEDADGDVEPATITINVDDDTPTVDVTLAAGSEPTLQTQDGETDGDPKDQDTASTNFAVAFNVNASAGADGAASSVVTYALGVSAPGVDSGLDQGGANIYLHLIGGVVVGSTSASAAGVNAANTVFSVSVDASGEVTLTQFSQVDHPAGGDPSPTGSPFTDHIASLADTLVTLTATATVTDNDGDVATDSQTLDIGANIIIRDDGPDAVNDSASQVGEGNAVTVNVFANDAPGADGVNVVGGIAVVPGSLTGAGVLVYNNNGTFTYTPAAGEQGSVTFQYRITDFDGDTDTATVTINLQPDSTPNAANGVAAVDDDGLGGNAASVTGDLNANTGEAAPVNPSEAIFHGQLSATGGSDTIVDYDFASMHGTSGSVGAETVNYTWDNATSTLTATGPRGPLFKVVVDQATGEYSLTLLDNVLHAAGGAENDATTNLTFTVRDNDGDTDTGTIAVTFDDDAPTIGTVQDQQTNNNPATAPAVGTLHFVAGADGAGSAMTITADVSGLTSGGFDLVTQQVGNVLTAYQDTDGDGLKDAGEGTAVFTLTVNPNAGTSGQYVFDLITPLDLTVTDIPVGGTTSFGAGPQPYQVVSQTNVATDPLAVITGWHTNGSFNATDWFNGTNQLPAGVTIASVNGSTAGWGVDNNNFTAGEFMRFDFGEPIDDFDGAGGYNPPNPAVNLPSITTATFELIGYGAGETFQFVLHYTDGTSSNATFAGNAGVVTVVALPGKTIDWIDLYSPNAGSGKVDLVSVGTQSSTIDETIPFTVQLTDGDGDATATADFDIRIASGLSPNPPAAQAPLVNKQAEVDKVAANTNSMTLAAAVAAAGMAESAAAASRPGGVADRADSELVANHSPRMIDRVADDGADRAGGSELAAKPVAAVQEVQASGAKSTAAVQTDHSLDDSQPSNAAAEPHQAADDQGPAPASADASPVAPTVAMVSAEALQAAGLDGAAKQDASVAEVVAEALGQADAPTVDGLLAHLGGGIGSVQALADVASQDAGSVPGWHMPAHGAFGGGFEMLIKGDVALSHHDAIQPAVNG